MLDDLCQKEKIVLARVDYILYRVSLTRYIHPNEHKIPFDLFFWVTGIKRTHLEAIFTDGGADIRIALFHLEAAGIGATDHVLPAIAVDIVGCAHGLLDLVSGARIHTPADEAIP